MSLHARLARKLLALAVCAGAASSAAQAVDRTRYVSINGNNNNACTLAAPCRTLQRGIDETPAGGEPRILDSGVLANNVTIAKSLTISGDGHTVFPGTSSMTIDAVGAVVTLRGLTLNGRGTIEHGVRIASAVLVHVERCTIHAFAGTGIFVTGTADGVSVFVIDSISRGNGTGLAVTNAEASRLTVDNSHFDSNGDDGVRVSNGYAAISRSAASGNVRFGISGDSPASISVVSTTAARNGSDGFRTSGGTLSVESSLSDGNGGAGLAVYTGGTARMSSSTFTDNFRGIANNGTIQTRQNNTVRGNGLDLIGSALTPIGGT